MKTKEITLYEYSELSPQAKKKALDYHREHGFDTYDLQVHLDNLISDLLEKHKIKPAEGTYAKIYYSLSNSQGDGAMFEGTFDWKNYTVKIKQSGHYYHSNSKVIEIVGENEHGTYDAPEADENAFEAIYQSICKELEKVGYEHIEDMESESYFIELCNANEWTFREDGTLELE